MKGFIAFTKKFQDPIKLDLKSLKIEQGQNNFQNIGLDPNLKE
jgi:hypothetical protein